MTDLNILFGLDRISELPRDQAMALAQADNIAERLWDGIPEGAQAAVFVSSAMAPLFAEIIEAGIDSALDYFSSPIEDFDDDPEEPALRRPGDGAPEPGG